MGGDCRLSGVSSLGMSTEGEVFVIDRDLVAVLFLDLGEDLSCFAAMRALKIISALIGAL